MIVNVANFILWLLSFVWFLIYTYLFLWPLAVLRAIKNAVLTPLSPVFAVCDKDSCTVNETGVIVLMIVFMLSIVGFLKWQGTRRGSR